MATDRILIHASIAEPFLQTLKDTLDSTTTNNEPPPTLINTASKARVHSLVSSALEAGAHLIHGSIDNDNQDSGVRMAPVLLGGINENMNIWREESFASLAACMVVDSDEEAVRVANSTGYGLSAAVFTEDLRKGLALARKIQSGYVFSSFSPVFGIYVSLANKRLNSAVHINSMTIHDEPVLPHGGVKNSGWGRFNAVEGLNEFLQTKTVTWLD